MSIILILLLVAVLAWSLSLLFVSNYSPFDIQDNPNFRSLHLYPTPRTGGIAIVTAISSGWICLYILGHQDPVLMWIIVAALLVTLVSFLDDLLKLSVLSRFIVHGVAAAILIFGSDSLPWGIIGNVLVWLAIVWMLNLYNFMDGMDGFSAGMTIVGFGVLGIIGWQQEAHTYALYCWVIASASVGFLVINFPPARIFMGDMGSINLGMLAAAFSLWGFQKELFSFWIPLLVFSPFVVDATVTIFLRLFKGEKIWLAHRSHFYQQLVLAGWSHKRTVLFEYVLMISCGASSILILRFPEIIQWVLGVWIIFYFLVILWVRKMGLLPDDGCR